MRKSTLSSSNPLIKAEAQIPASSALAFPLSLLLRVLGKGKRRKEEEDGRCEPAEQGTGVGAQKQ